MSTRKPAGNNTSVGTGEGQSHSHDGGLPTHNEGGAQHATGHGESGRNGFHPFSFLRICFRSTSTVSKFVNLLWPVVPAAIAVRYALPQNYVVIFVLSYIAMIPAANTVGFAGQELARKLPHVFGVILETTLGSLVEIILFLILVIERQIPVVRAAILGSILANLLLCLGACFIAGGLSRHEQTFHEIVSEVGSGLMLVAGFGLILPAIFSIATTTTSYALNEAGQLLSTTSGNAKVLSISRGTAIILLISYLVYIYFNMSSHHSLITEVFEADEERDHDRHYDEAKEKLTLTECVVALTISIAVVTFVAVILVQGIEPIVEEGHISDAFLGLILVPLVEKAAEHLTAIDEAFDNQANLALAHVLGASLQTALLNTPIVVLVGWILHIPMDLNFGSFESVVLIISIVVVGNFLRDGKSNYLEGFLCVSAYAIIALAAWYYPDPTGEEPFPGLNAMVGSGLFGRPVTVQTVIGRGL